MLQKRKRSWGFEGRVSTDGSRLAAYVIPTDEKLMIARDF